MAMTNYDVVYIDDEASITELFIEYVGWRFRYWRAAAFNDPIVVHEKLMANEISAAVWIVDIMMPGKNGAEMAAVIARENGPGTIVLGYTALDPHVLEMVPEYRAGLRYFSKILNKQENFFDLLDLVDVWVRKGALTK